MSQMSTNSHRNSSSSTAPSAAVISVKHQDALVDEKVILTCTGLEKSSHVTLHASVCENKMRFGSYAWYFTDDNGCVDLSRQESVQGTYTGLEPMGLFWSMIQEPGQQSGLRFQKKDVTEPVLVNVNVFNGHFNWEDLYNKSLQPMASTTVRRWYKATDVKREVIRVGNIRGALFLPPGNGPFPGVIDMFGSAGGLFEFRASLLASRGFACLALAYFAYEDLPKTMFEIKLDYFLIYCQLDSEPMSPCQAQLLQVEEVNNLKNGLSRTITKCIVNLTISGFIGDVHLVSHGKVFNEALTYPLPQVTRHPLVLQHKQYCKEALDWLISHPLVNPDGVGIVGVSKGAEICQFMAVHYPKVHAVVNISASPYCTAAPLLINGKEVPTFEGKIYVLGRDKDQIVPDQEEKKDYQKVQRKFFSDFYSNICIGGDLFKFDWSDKGLVMKPAYTNFEDTPRIEIWKSGAKFLNIVGEDDQCVDSVVLSSHVDGYPPELKSNIETVVYPRAGHLIEPPYSPFCRASYNKLVNGMMVWGGYSKDHAYAQEDSWKRILNFLHKYIIRNKSQTIQKSRL